MIEACILAGGMSTRMGQDKARLRLGGRSLLAHVRAATRKAGLPVRVIRRDLVPRCGPLGGVCTGLRTSQADAVLFLSCDMPLVDAPLLREVLASLGPQQNAAFVAQGERVGFPFVIRRGALPEVEKLISEQEFSLQRLARRLSAALVRPSPNREHTLCNINTLADFQRAQELWNEAES